MRLFHLLVMLCIVSGCASYGPEVDEPPPNGYTITPHILSEKIASADHIVVTNVPAIQHGLSYFVVPAAVGGRIVVTNLPAGQQGSPQVASYSLTITGQEMEQIIHAISSLRTSEYNHASDVSTSYKWQLQFYQGTVFLGAADLSKDSVFDGTFGLFSPPPLVFFDGGMEYPAPRILKKLYHRVTKESQTQDRAMPPNKLLQPTATAPSALTDK